MMVFLNGTFVPEQAALVSVFDRSFLYGDGLFETMLVSNSVPFRWSQHLERLQRGADFLGICLPLSAAELRAAAAQLLLKNQMAEGLLRLTLSRGVGLRGYSPRGADTPTLVMTTHPLAGPHPADLHDWRLHTATIRLPANEPLAQFKTCNKLAQILARVQAEHEQADEALLLNTDGFVVEGASSNLFWVRDQTIYTPPLASGILSGVTRLVVLELCPRLGLASEERNITAVQLQEADGVFLSLSSRGIVQGASLDSHPLRFSIQTERLQQAYRALVTLETASVSHP